MLFDNESWAMDAALLEQQPLTLMPRMLQVEGGGGGRGRGGERRGGDNWLDLGMGEGWQLARWGEGGGRRREGIDRWAPVLLHCFQHVEGGGLFKQFLAIIMSLAI